MANVPLTTILWAIASGILPTFFWLWFWLRYDKRPEPRGLLAIAFLSGALMVMVAIPLQGFVLEIVQYVPYRVASLAFIEELLKFGSIAILIFTTKYIDEPSDYGIYLITAALGFAALENMLFLMNPTYHGNVGLTLAAGNLRFLGSTVLHAISGALVGVSMGVVFYKDWFIKVFYAGVGLLAATALHALFNIFIMKNDDVHIMSTMAILWVVSVIIVFMFRRLRFIQPPYHYRY